MLVDLFSKGMAALGDLRSKAGPFAMRFGVGACPSRIEKTFVASFEQNFSGKEISNRMVETQNKRLLFLLRVMRKAGQFSQVR